MPRTWLAPQLDPAAITKCKGKRRTDGQPAIAFARLGIVLGGSRQSNSLAPGKHRSRQGESLGAASERQESGLAGAKQERAEWMRSQRRRGGKEAEGRTQAVALNKGEWHKRVARVMLASVAQQSVAPERGRRRSHDSFNAVARAR